MSALAADAARGESDHNELAAAAGGLAIAGDSFADLTAKISSSETGDELREVFDSITALVQAGNEGLDKSTLAQLGRDKKTSMPTAWTDPVKSAFARVMKAYRDAATRKEQQAANEAYVFPASVGVVCVCVVVSVCLCVCVSALAALVLGDFAVAPARARGASIVKK